MFKLNKAILSSPILGATILTIISFVYIMIFNFSFKSQEVINLLLAIVKTFPLVFIIFLIISYILSLPIGFLIYREMQKDLRTEVYFINMALFVGFIISIIISIIDYHIYHILAKSFFIVIGMSIMATANATYFMVLSGYIKIKEKKNDTTKGKRF